MFLIIHHDLKSCKKGKQEANCNNYLKSQNTINDTYLGLLRSYIENDIKIYYCF